MSASRRKIFLDILAGESRCVKVYEDEYCLAILNIFPHKPGHVLVLPKRTDATNVLEMNVGLFARLMQVAQYITPHVIKAMGADAAKIDMSTGPAAGLLIDYPHVHIICYKQGQYTPRPSSDPGWRVLEEDGEKIRAAISGALD